MKTLTKDVGFIITEQKPYTFKVHKEGFFRTDWAVQFEGQTIRIVQNTNATDIEHIVSLLNCAYQCGFSSGMVWGKSS